MVDEVLFTSEVAPLAPNVPIVDLKNGNPTSYFMRVISTWLKEKKLTEDQLFGLGLDGLNDVDTVSDVPTEGDLLIFDGEFWVPFAPGASGKVLTSAGDTNMPTWETPATSSGGGYFGGYNNNTGASDTQAFATKGHFFRPARDIYVTAMCVYMAPSAGSQTHRAQIATVNTSTGTIGVSVALSSDITSLNSTAQWYRIPFASPVLLTAGTDYLFAIVNASGTGTTSVNLGGATTGKIEAPGTISGASADIKNNKQLRYNTINVSASQAVSGSTSSVGYLVYPEGYGA